MKRCRIRNGTTPRTPKPRRVAEQMILESNSESLATMSIRPALDLGTRRQQSSASHHRPRQDRPPSARSGMATRSSIRSISTTPSRPISRPPTDSSPGSPVAGRTYFVTQGETVPIWDMINHLLKAAHLAPVKRTISRPMAVAVSGLLEAAYLLSGRTDEPPMTRFMARHLSTTHWFNNDAARRDLGYQPRVSIAQGLHALKVWLHRESALGQRNHPRVRFQIDSDATQAF